MHSDTSTEAAAVQRAIVLGWTPEERLRRTLAMCEGAFELMRAGIRARHPEYAEGEVELARRRIVWGDELFRRACPDAPLLDP